MAAMENMYQDFVVTFEIVHEVFSLPTVVFLKQQNVFEVKAANLERLESKNC